jgi:predicted HicB family RNase H-like nuclease
MKEITYVRLEPEVKRIVEQAAKADQRSLSAFINKLISEWASRYQAAKPRRQP